MLQTTADIADCIVAIIFTDSKAECSTTIV